MINFLRTQVFCPICGVASKFSMTFEYGHCRVYDYEIGDLVQWMSHDDVGDIGNKYVRVDATGGPCINCKERFIDFDIFIRDNRIENVRPAPKRELTKSADYDVLNESDYLNLLNEPSQ